MSDEVVFEAALNYLEHEISELERPEHCGYGLDAYYEERKDAVLKHLKVLVSDWKAFGSTGLIRIMNAHKQQAAEKITAL